MARRLSVYVLLLLLLFHRAAPVQAETKIEKGKAKLAASAEQARSSREAVKPGNDGAAKPTSMADTLGIKSSAKDDDAPLYIKSDTLDLDSKGRIFTYRGNVDAIKGDLHITSGIMVGNYDEQSRIDTVTCRENVVITRGETMKATSNRAVYDVKAGTIVLTEGPELYNQGNALSADKVTLYVDEDRSEAEGNVQVKVIKQEGEAPKSGGKPGDKPAPKATKK